MALSLALTDTARNEVARVQSGGSLTLAFTRVLLGTGNPGATRSVHVKQIALSTQTHALSVTSSQGVSTGQINIFGEVQPDTTISWTEVGLEAQVGSETPFLYAYESAVSPLLAGGGGLRLSVRIQTVVDGTSSVTLTLTRPTDWRSLDGTPIDYQDGKLLGSTARGLVYVDPTPFATSEQVSGRANAEVIVKPSQIVSAIPNASQTVRGLSLYATDSDARNRLSASRAVNPAQVESAIRSASPTRRGLVRQASDGEITSRATASVFVSPGQVSALVPMATIGVAGIVQVARLQQVRDRVSDTLLVRPHHILAAVPSATNAVEGKIRTATSPEAESGSNLDVAIKPGQVTSAVDDATTSRAGKTILASTFTRADADAVLTQRIIPSGGFARTGHEHTLLQLTDTPSSYDNGKVLVSTSGGTLWADRTRLASEQEARARSSGVALQPSQATSAVGIASNATFGLTKLSVFATRSASNDVLTRRLIPSAGWAAGNHTHSSLAGVRFFNRRVSGNNVHAFRAHRVRTGRASTQDVVFTIEEFDLSSRYSTSSGRYTVLYSGLYRFDVLIHVTADNFMHLLRNGAVIAEGEDFNFFMPLTYFGRFRAGDYVSVRAQFPSRIRTSSSLVANKNTGAVRTLQQRDLSYFSGYAVTFD